MDQQLEQFTHQRRAVFRPRRRGARDERGFTFVEALIAIGILAGGMVAVAQLLVISLQMHHLGRRTSEASGLAAAKLEELMKLSFDTSAAVAVTPVSPDSLGTNVANYFDTTSAGYTRRWKVTAGPAANTRQVTLRVIPPNLDRNRFKTVEVTTILRRW
jgi:Tfp pilus assembly protein PilV